jgi:GT2 family glycosyltransferase
MISIIIPTYNRAELLALSLNSLAQQRASKNDYEVIVVDDGSTDATQAVIERHGTGMQLRSVRQEHRGFRVARARNLGVERSSGSVLAFVDCGVVVGKDFVCEQMRLRAGGMRWTDAAHIGYVYAFNNYQDFTDLPCRVPFGNPDLAKSLIEKESYFHDVRESNYASVGDHLGKLCAPWSLFWSTNISITRQAFLSVGGFDEAFSNWGMEDVELGYRLYASGCPIVLGRSIWGIHHPHDRDNQANFATNDVNKLMFLRKHPNFIAEIYLSTTGLALEETYAKFAERCRLVSQSVLANEQEFSTRLQRTVRSLSGRILVVGVGASFAARSHAHCLCLEFDESFYRRHQRQDNVRLSIGAHVDVLDNGFDAAILIGVDRVLRCEALKQTETEVARVAREVTIFEF